MKAFISYSHVDERALQRLHTHLAVMRKEGSINEWYDRKIKAGDALDAAVLENLQSSEIFIALVSPDFLASDYCYDVEMKTAMEMHSEGKMRIVSIIIEPCDWKSTPLQKFKATPKDGKPVSDWSNENTAYVDVIRELRSITKEQIEVSILRPAKTKTTPQESRVAVTPKYRTKKSFDEIDKINFKKDTFKHLKHSLKDFVDEANSVEGIKGLFEDSDKNRFFVTLVNRDRANKTANLTVYISDGRSGFGDINILHQRSDSSNSSNGAFIIENDDYDLFLNPSIFSFGTNEKRLDPQGAANYLWNNLLERADISHA